LKNVGAKKGDKISSVLVVSEVRFSGMSVSLCSASCRAEVTVVTCAVLLRLFGMARNEHSPDKDAMGGSGSIRASRPATHVALAWLAIHELFPQSKLQRTSYGVGNRL